MDALGADRRTDASTQPAAQDTGTHVSPPEPHLQTVHEDHHVVAENSSSAEAATCLGPGSVQTFTLSTADYIADRVTEHTLAFLSEVLPELCSQQSALIIEGLQKSLQSSMLPQERFRRKSNCRNLHRHPAECLSKASDLRRPSSAASAASSAKGSVCASDETQNFESIEGEIRDTSSVDTRQDTASNFASEQVSASMPVHKRESLGRNINGRSSTRSLHSEGRLSRTSKGKAGTSLETGSFHRDSMDAGKDGGWNVKELEFNLMSSVLECHLGFAPIHSVGTHHHRQTAKQSMVRMSKAPLRSDKASTPSIASRIAGFRSWWKKSSPDSTKVVPNDSPWTNSAQNLGPPSSSPEGASLRSVSETSQEASLSTSIESGVSADSQRPGSKKPPRTEPGPAVERIKSGLNASPADQHSGVMDLIAQNACQIVCGAGQSGLGHSPAAAETGSESQSDKLYERQLSTPTLSVQVADVNTPTSCELQRHISEPVSFGRFSARVYCEETAAPPSQDSLATSADRNLSISVGQVTQSGTTGCRASAYNLVPASRTSCLPLAQGPRVSAAAPITWNYGPDNLAARDELHAPRDNSVNRFSGVHMLQPGTPKKDSLTSRGGLSTSLGVPLGRLNSPSMISTSSGLRIWRTSQLVHHQNSTDTYHSQRSSGCLEEEDLDNEGDEVFFEESAEPMTRRPLYALKISGIIPWQELDSLRTFPFLYQWTLLLLATLSFGACMEATIRTRLEVMGGSQCYSSACLKLGLLSDIPLSLGCLFGLVSLGVHRRSRALVQCIEMLSCYAARSGFHEKWLHLANRDLIFVSIIWIIAALERARGSGLVEAVMDGRLVAPWDGWLQVVAFAVTSFGLLSLTFCVLYVCRALMTMVDTYCCEMIHIQNLNKAPVNWNIVTAFLRQTSFTIEFCYFVLQTTTLSCCVLGVADVVLLMRNGTGGLETLMPGALVTLGIARIFFSAASVTDKCAHVPSLVNSLSFGQEDELDLERQYVVNYIIHSAAGFYVFEVRLTSAMSLKFAYFCAVAGFTLTTTILSDV